MSASAETHALPEPEDPGLVAANLNVGVLLLVSAILFAFVAFVFAFGYLKAVNSNSDWRPAHVDPSQGYGIGILVGVLATAVVFELARRVLAGTDRRSWRALAGTALALSLAVVVVEVLQLTGSSFSITGGGYASVFYGWNALLIAIWLGAVYWVETLLAGSLRTSTNSEHLGGGGLVATLQASARACTTYLAAMSGIQIATYVLFYLIK